MIGVEFIKGYGLGNQLFFFVSARCVAKELGYDFGTINPQQVGRVAQSNAGMYWMQLDLGKEIPAADRDRFTRFDEQEDRIILGQSKHDMTYGCYVSGADPKVWEIQDNTLLYGNLQAEEYFGKYREDIKKWLKVLPEYDSHEYTSDDLCIINLRGGEYVWDPALYLGRRYWLHAIENMKKINPKMRFMIVTEDEEHAKKLLPEYECHHFSVEKDYVTIKNARYLILSNSSFSLWPVMTSEELRYVIAPKYWARHNVSDGYWSSEQNIYSFLHYQDRDGRICEPDECRKELADYKKRSGTYARRNKTPGPVRHIGQVIRRKLLYAGFYLGKIRVALLRKTGIIKTWKPENS